MKIKKKNMMVLFLGILCLGNVVYAQTNETPPEENAINPYGTARTLISSIQKWSSLYQDLENEKLALEFEESFDFPSQKKREEILKENGELEKQYEQKKNEIELEKTTLEDKKDALKEIQETNIDSEGDFAVLDEQKQQIEKEIALLENNILDLGKETFEIETQRKANTEEIEKLETMFEERKAEQKENIERSKERIIELEEEIAKQKVFVKNQGHKAVYDILLLLGIIAILLLLRYVSKIIIRRLSVNLSQKRKGILFNLNKIIFNVLIVIVVLGIIFSQIVNLLPFIAILSTGLAFAVRDSIACFIGWFVIGTDRGFKVGHVIKIDDVFGQVREIGPILTRIYEMKGREKTGKFISIPNKYIFEKEIINLSQNYNITQEKVIFLLDPESDILKAKNILEKILKKANTINHAKLKQYEKRIEKNTTIGEEFVEEHVLIRQTLKGPELHAKFFASFETINQVQEKTVTEFINTVREEKDIQIKFLDY